MQNISDPTHSLSDAYRDRLRNMQASGVPIGKDSLDQFARLALADVARGSTSGIGNLEFAMKKGASLRPNDAEITMRIALIGVVEGKPEAMDSVQRLTKLGVRPNGNDFKDFIDRAVRDADAGKPNGANKLEFAVNLADQWGQRPSVDAAPAQPKGDAAQPLKPGAAAAAPAPATAPTVAQQHHVLARPLQPIDIALKMHPDQPLPPEDPALNAEVQTGRILAAMQNIRGMAQRSMQSLLQAMTTVPDEQTREHFKSRYQAGERPSEESTALFVRNALKGLNRGESQGTKNLELAHELGMPFPQKDVERTMNVEMRAISNGAGGFERLEKLHELGCKGDQERLDLFARKSLLNLTQNNLEAERRLQLAHKLGANFDQEDAQRALRSAMKEASQGKLDAERKLGVLSALGVTLNPEATVKGDPVAPTAPRTTAPVEQPAQQQQEPAVRTAGENAMRHALLSMLAKQDPEAEDRVRRLHDMGVRPSDDLASSFVRQSLVSYTREHPQAKANLELAHRLNMPFAQDDVERTMRLALIDVQRDKPTAMDRLETLHRLGGKPDTDSLDRFVRNTLIDLTRNHPEAESRLKLAQTLGAKFPKEEGERTMRLAMQDAARGDTRGDRRMEILTKLGIKPDPSDAKLYSRIAADNASGSARADVGGFSEVVYKKDAGSPEDAPRPKVIDSGLADRISSLIGTSNSTDQAEVSERRVVRPR